MEDVIFKNRSDAGEKLSHLLETYKNADAIVLALPRGGVPVAEVIAKNLNLAFDILKVKKIGHPNNSEYAIGAITEHGVRVLSPNAKFEASQNFINSESKRLEILARVSSHRYHQFLTPKKIGGKTVIIVDDGIATGLSLFAAIIDVRKRKVKKITVAAPVCPRDVANQIKELVDELYIYNIPDEFIGAVGAFYSDFKQVSNNDVDNILSSFSKIKRR